MSVLTSGSAEGSVRLDLLSKRFHSGVYGIKDVSLDIEEGEFISFLGPSGSGKTTTLNAIGGFIRPTSGSITIGGKDATSLPPNKRNLGMVFQNYALFPHMTIRENIAFGLHGRKLTKAESITRIDEVLQMVGLEKLADRHPKEVSGGQQQRAALARALVYRPPVLLMDEPLSALDKALRDQMQEEIARIHQEVGTTFLFVTHDQDEALGLSDRIALFNEGRVVQVGTPQELYESPATLFAAKFVGESNVFRGKVAGDSTVQFGLEAIRVNSLPPTVSEVAIVVRPERVSLASLGDPATSSAMNQVEATVTGVSYFGSYQRVSLEYRDGSLGLAKPQIEAATAYSPGDKVAVLWSPDHGIVVPDEQ